MLVKNWISKEMITIDANDTVLKAATLFKEKAIDLLPVVDDGKLSGIITRNILADGIGSGIKSMEISKFLIHIAELKVKDIMIEKPVTIYDNSTIEAASEILLDKNLIALPVIDHDNRLKGVISGNDIFRVLISLLGTRKCGLQIALLLEDKPGSLKEVTDVLRKYGCRVISILSTIHEQVGHRHVYINTCDCDQQKLTIMKEELKEKFKVLYFADQGTECRELYQEYERPRTEWYIG